MTTPEQLQSGTEDCKSGWGRLELRLGLLWGRLRAGVWGVGVGGCYSFKSFPGYLPQHTATQAVLPIDCRPHCLPIYPTDG